jgi:hypothetical protein
VLHHGRDEAVAAHERVRVVAGLGLRVEPVGDARGHLVGVEQEELALDARLEGEAVLVLEPSLHGAQHVSRPVVEVVAVVYEVAGDVSDVAFPRQHVHRFLVGVCEQVARGRV